MTFQVKWFSSSMQGAALLSSGKAGAAHTVTQGSLIALLKACLVTGFGSMSASSAVYNSATSTITFTTASAHAYQKWQIIESSGWNEAAFNGEFRVKSVTSTTVTVGLDNGTPTVTSATGSGTVKIPGLGWAVAFEDAATYRCIFKRTDAAATEYMLYVDNSAWSGWNNNNGHLAKVLVVSGVTDISTFTVVSDKRWPCSHNYATPDWLLIGDSKYFVFMPKFAAPGAREFDSFGDFVSLRAGDKHNTIFSFHYSATTESINWSDSSLWPYNNAGLINESSYRQVMRGVHQLPGVVSAKIAADHLGGILGAGLPLTSSPVNLADSGFYSAKNLKIFDDVCWRGVMPGLVAPYSSPSEFDKSVVQSVNGDLTLYTLVARKASDSAQASVLLGFDIKGPWR